VLSTVKFMRREYDSDLVRHSRQLLRRNKQFGAFDQNSSFGGGVHTKISAVAMIIAIRSTRHIHPKVSVSCKRATGNCCSRGQVEARVT